MEIEVVNFWLNRIIGDAALPPDQRLARTSVRTLTESGLPGPVQMLEQN
ncbi:MAG: hypothetical protein PHY43_11295 [Verrucomicrobiales bacterium]|nr:hypothetical protein [Verrucomicrobiales bacterium]